MIKNLQTMVQPGILGAVPSLARYVTFSRLPEADSRSVLKLLSSEVDGDGCVVGIGLSTVLALEGNISSLRCFPAQVGNGLAVPSTPAELWCWFRGMTVGFCSTNPDPFNAASPQRFGYRK